jgi:hypothetical protein
MIGICINVYSSSKPKIKATSPNSEVVVAEGMAPIINNDISSAKNVALKDALKNALGLVVGIYISQESLVSKAILIEDNITSNSEGYIEKYTILKEWKDNDFYKTQVKALVRKEDLSDKIKKMELEPQKLGNPIIKFEIKETIDGQLSNTKYSENELKKKFVENGFVVSDSLEGCDILVTGTVDTNFNSDFSGLMSYRASMDLKILKADSKDIITTANKMLASMDITKNASAKKSIIEVSNNISKDLPTAVLKFLKEKSSIQLTISKIPDLNKLNSVINSIRTLTEVRDSWTRNYLDGNAVIDLSIKNNSSSKEIAKRLEQINSAKIKINKINAYSIDAELLS